MSSSTYNISVKINVTLNYVYLINDWNPFIVEI